MSRRLVVRLAGTPVGGLIALVAAVTRPPRRHHHAGIGKYCWRAVYSGDGFYNGSAHTNAASECFTTVKQDSQTETLSDPTGGGVVPGTQVRDNATVTGIPTARRRVVRSRSSLRA